MRNIIDLYEASILDIEGSIEDGNKYSNVDLEMITKAKSKEEFDIFYDILMSMVEDEEKEPPTKKINDKTYITSGNNKLYIRFKKQDSKYGELRNVVIGGEKAVFLGWHPYSNKYFDGNMFSKFSEVDLTDCDCVRYLPKRLHDQAQRIIKRIK